MQTKILSVDKSEDIVTLDSASEFQRITDDYDELVVTGCLDAAIDLVEQWMNRKLYPTRVIGQVAKFQNVITLHYPEIHSVDPVITAMDASNATVNLNVNEHWVFDDIFGEIRFIANADSYTNFRVTYECGYHPDTNPVPSAVIHAILMTASTLYEFREDAVTGTQVNAVPLQAKRLIQAHRNRVNMQGG